MSMRVAGACLVVVLASLVWCQSAAAQAPAAELEIAIEETVWGFDGKAVRETFTPLSILVRNPGARMASGTLRLSREFPNQSTKEPALDIPFDVPPFEERWIQAAPYILDDYIPWQIKWGPSSSQTIEVPQARMGEAATILLVNPNDRPRSSGLLRRFRTNLFPASVTATDGLRAVFLNSVPDLQGARLQAFLEWLQRGGRVVLLHGDDQQFPRFPSALAALNNPADSFQVGSGLVRRLALDVSDVNQSQISSVTMQLGRAAAERNVAAAFQDPYKTYHGRYPWNRDRGVLEKLEGVSRFHRRWWVIYPLAVLYLLAIFPGSYACAQTPRGVRRFYVVYFATAVAFSWAFKTLGGVGGGEKNRIRSATIARQLSPGVFDCSQWCCLAAVDGGMYSLSHEGSGRWYSHHEEFEAPYGRITAGPEAKYEVDIPVASTRTAVVRFRAAAPAVAVQSRSIEFVDRNLNSCTFALSGLPGEPIEAFACHRDSTFRLQKSGGDAWSSDRRRATPTSVFMTDLQRLPDYTMNLRGKQAIENRVTTDFFRSLERPLIGNAFDMRDHIEASSGMLSPGIVRVMALVDTDDAFAGAVPGFADVQGCVLYVMDVPVSEE